MGNLIPPQFIGTGDPDASEESTFSISTLILGMFIGMAILYIINLFFPVVHSITNEEQVFKEGIHKGAEAAIGYINKGIKQIPLPEIQNTAWTNRVEQQKITAEETGKDKFWQKWIPKK